MGQWLCRWDGNKYVHVDRPGTYQSRLTGTITGLWNNWPTGCVGIVRRANSSPQAWPTKIVLTQAQIYTDIAILEDPPLSPWHYSLIPCLMCRCDSLWCHMPAIDLSQCLLYLPGGRWDTFLAQPRCIIMLSVWFCHFFLWHYASQTLNCLSPRGNRARAVSNNVITRAGK